MMMFSLVVRGCLGTLLVEHDGRAEHLGSPPHSIFMVSVFTVFVKGNAFCKQQNTRLNFFGQFVGEVLKLPYMLQHVQKVILFGFCGCAAFSLL